MKEEVCTERTRGHRASKKRTEGSEKIREKKRPYLLMHLLAEDTSIVEDSFYK